MIILHTSIIYIISIRRCYFFITFLIHNPQTYAKPNKGKTRLKAFDVKKYFVSSSRRTPTLPFWKPMVLQNKQHAHDLSRAGLCNWT